MSDEMEQVVKGAKTMTDVSNAAKKSPNLRERFPAGVKPAIVLLSETQSRLDVKGKQLKMLEST